MWPSFRYRRLSLIWALLLLWGLLGSLSAQQKPDSVTVPLAPEFEKEWPYGILFGNHHQSLWTVPVTLELLSLSSHAGGLTPCREVVTPNNRLLLLATSTGDTMVFTPLRERFADDAADPRDRRLIPTHPSSALVTDELSGAAGLLHLQPRLVWLPDDSLLGQFRGTYGGSAGFLAFPRYGTTTTSVPFLDSRELFRALDADSRNAADTRAFLLSRFIDLLTGDWQRSIWKWWWVATPENGWTLYTPMPAIRRHSLLMLSSFPEMVHGVLTPGFVNFTGDLGDVSRAVTTGAALDVRILSGTDRRSWERIAGEFTTLMSDSAIDAALRKLPGPHRQAEADTIARLLRLRRDSFAAVSSRYYRTIAEYAEVRLSDSPEYVTIDRLEDGRVDVTAWQRGLAPTPVYRRVFLPEETKEIRLQCLGGNDTVIVRGRAEQSIVVRVSGGPGDDALKDESTVRTVETGFLGWLFSGTPMTFLYDHEGVNEIVGGEITSIDTSPESEFVPPGRFF
jgi:hypothetical protein